MTTEPETPVGSAVDVAWLRLGGPEGEDTRDDILSPQIRSQRARQGRATKLTRSHATGFRVGDQVRTNTPRSRRFHDLAGRVIATNLGEVGVSFNAKVDVDAWFLPSELSHR